MTSYKPVKNKQKHGAPIKAGSRDRMLPHDLPSGFSHVRKATGHTGLRLPPHSLPVTLPHESQFPCLLRFAVAGMLVTAIGIAYLQPSLSRISSVNTVMTCSVPRPAWLPVLSRDRLSCHPRCVWTPRRVVLRTPTSLIR